MEGFLKQSTAVDVTILMIDSTDHITGKTGLSAGLTIYATKAGGTPAAITPTVTELDAVNVKGLYKLALTTTHTNTLGELQLHITASGADPTDIKWQVATYLPGEAVTLQADQAVNVTKVNGTSQTARDLGAQLDATVSSRLASASYTAPLDAAGTRTAVGLASANLDTQIATLSTSAVTTAIKAKTDSLIFTVAGQVDANVQSVNDVTITGNGSSQPFNV